MQNKINAPFLLFFLTISLLFSCDKDNFNKEFGRYALAVNYANAEFLELHFFIDGQDAGSFTPVPNLPPSYVADCSALKQTENLNNIFILNEVSPGDHILEVKTADGTLVKTLTFQMMNKECVFQDLSIDLK